MAPTCDNFDPVSGYSAATKTYRNPNPLPPLPSESTPLTISDFVFSLLLSSYPESSALDTVPFLIDASVEDQNNSVITFSHFIRQVNSLSSALHHPTTNSIPAIRRGDVALILAPTSLRIPVLYFSLFSIGAVIAPVNPVATASELTHITQLINPAVVFTLSDLKSKLPSHLPTILLDSPEFDTIIIHPHSDTNSFQSDEPIPQSDTAIILFSSGTTGRMKGVEITHRAVITSIAGNHHTLARDAGVGPSRRGGRMVSLFTVPVFHVYGLYFLIWAVAAAETVVLTPGRFDLEGMLRAVERFKVKQVPVSPPVVVAWVKSDLTKKLDLRSLTRVLCGGAPLGSDVVERFKAKFPTVHLVQGYGLTEVGGSITSSIEGVDPEHYGSVGRLTELIEAKIVDPLTGESLPSGQRGELWVKSPSVMKGYVGDEKATKKTLVGEGWLKTGDLCYFDTHGFMFVVDRLKEMIKYKGYQVPPAELEHVLLSHPKIADAAVVPYPDEASGQIPIAFVVRKPGCDDINGDQIMDFVAKEVSPYKKVRRVTFINKIPKSPTGKILRRELVKLVASTTSTTL